MKIYPHAPIPEESIVSYLTDAFVLRHCALSVYTNYFDIVHNRRTRVACSLRLLISRGGIRSKLDRLRRTGQTDIVCVRNAITHRAALQNATHIHTRSLFLSLSLSPFSFPQKFPIRLRSSLRKLFTTTIKIVRFICRYRASRATEKPCAFVDSTLRARDDPSLINANN